MRAATITCCSIWNNGPRNFQKMELLYLAYHISKYFDHVTSKIINRRNNMLRKLAAIGIQPNVLPLEFSLMFEHYLDWAHVTKIDTSELEILTFWVFLTWNLGGQGKDDLKMFFYYDIVAKFDSFLGKSQYLKILSMALFGLLTTNIYLEFSGLNQFPSILQNNSDWVHLPNLLENNPLPPLLT